MEENTERRIKKLEEEVEKLKKAVRNNEPRLQDRPCSEETKRLIYMSCV